LPVAVAIWNWDKNSGFLMQEYRMFRHFPFLLLFLLVLVSGNILAQNDELAYTEELVYGVNFNTNAGLFGGVAFKWARSKGEKQYHGFGIELVNVKHPKEYRRPAETGNTFIEYKKNYLFSFRPSYLREWVLFRKAAEEGVHINFIAGGGPSLGILKKYFVLYRESNDPRSTYFSVPYTEDIEVGRINGNASFSEGFNQLRISPGVHARAAISFEFGQIKNSVAGLETGFVVEQFSRKQEILAFAENRSFFTSFYLTLYFGKKY
jgi:hypothetical protein